MLFFNSLFVVVLFSFACCFQLLLHYQIAKSRNESLFSSGDYSTLELLDHDASKDSELHIRSVDEHTAELEYDDDFRYTSDDMALKKVIISLSSVNFSVF